MQAGQDDSTLGTDNERGEHMGVNTQGKVNKVPRGGGGVKQNKTQRQNLEINGK